ncbi:hypothetical protein TNCV_494451 [Trichonephila clavipes]|nr:hypothetical protein TNCV_494451 [Trichonephila clavipes]
MPLCLLTNPASATLETSRWSDSSSETPWLSQNLILKIQFPPHFLVSVYKGGGGAIFTS